MKRKLSRNRKLLYTLISSSLIWHAALPVHAEEIAEAASAVGQVTEETSVAKQSEFSLDKVEVTAKRDASDTVYAGGQVARKSNVGILGNKDFMDTPFSITSYTAQSIADKQASTLFDVLSGDSSIRYTTSSGHMNENYSIRGLDVNYEHLYFNGMQGLAPLNHVPVEMLENVEVLKGPASFLYGGVNTSVGGTINLVPKRAGEKDITDFTTDYTSSGQLGGHIDIGRRVGNNKEFGIRFNGVYKNGDTETDGQSKERQLAALGLDYKSGKWRLAMDAYSSEESYENGTVSMYNLANGYVKPPDGSTNVLKGVDGTSRNKAVLLKSEIDFDSYVTGYASIGRLENEGVGSLTGNHVRNLHQNGNATVNLYKQYFWTDAVSSELGLRGKYQTGAVKHQWVLGSSFTHSESDSYSNLIGAISTNIYNPVSLSSYWNSVATPSKTNKTSSTDLASNFFADTLSFDKDKVQLTLGLRHQEVETKSYNRTTGAQTAGYKADADTPVVGLVVKPWGNSVSLYANYIEALSPGTKVGTGYDNEGEVLAPYKSKQQEFGVKWDNGNFANTLAFFRITKPSQLTVNNVYTYGGEQENRGIEWNTFGKIAPNLRLLGGVTYLKAKTIRSAVEANEGKTPYGVPDWMINAGFEWDTPWDKGLALSVQAVYTGSQYANSGNTMKLPSWVRYDIGARYNTMMDKTPLTLRLSVENVFNEHYWGSSFSDNYVTLGNPRTVKFSATMHL